MRCSSCDQYLTPDSFYIINGKNISRKDILGRGHKSRCKECDAKSFLSRDHRSKLLHPAKQRAKEKGLEFDLTIEDIIIPERCPALGITLKPSVGEGSKSLTKLETSPSIDRIDNAKGYTKDNICVISLRANNIKKNATMSELKLILFHADNPASCRPKDYSAELLKQSKAIADERLEIRMQAGSPPSHGLATLRCSACQRDLSVDAFYLLKNKKAGRLAPDGTIRARKCPECSVDDFLRTDHRNKLLNAARRRAKLFNREFNLVREDIIIPEFCPVLGIRLQPTVGTGRKNLNELSASPSIDRIDSSRGYTPDNIQVVSFRVNDLKKDATLEEMRSLVKYVESFERS